MFPAIMISSTLAILVMIGVITLYLLRCKKEKHIDDVLIENEISNE
jgi:hypothetical protein